MPVRVNIIRARFPEDGLAVFRSGGIVRRVSPDKLEIKTPCIILLIPKYPHNVGQAVRLASCYGIKQVLITGNRVPLETTDKHYRLPREERMKGYQDVELIQYDDPFSLLPNDAIPVAVEMRPNSECLRDFSHPARAVYIFGPEDGGIPGSVLKRCHRFVVIPTLHCLNLATAVGTVLYDRQAYGTKNV